MKSSNTVGNPNHDELGRFASSPSDNNDEDVDINDLNLDDLDDLDDLDLGDFKLDDLEESEDLELDDLDLDDFDLDDFELNEDFLTPIPTFIDNPDAVIDNPGLVFTEQVLNDFEEYYENGKFDSFGRVYVDEKGKIKRTGLLLLLVKNRYGHKFPHARECSNDEYMSKVGSLSENHNSYKTDLEFERYLKSHPYIPVGRGIEASTRAEADEIRRGFLSSEKYASTIGRGCYGDITYISINRNYYEGWYDSGDVLYFYVKSDGFKYITYNQYNALRNNFYENKERFMTNFNNVINNHKMSGSAKNFLSSTMRRYLTKTNSMEDHSNVIAAMLGYDVVFNESHQLDCLNNNILNLNMDKHSDTYINRRR